MTLFNPYKFIKELSLITDRQGGNEIKAVTLILGYLKKASIRVKQ